MIKTRLTELVGLKYPIIQAGMGPYPVTSLCIAAANAGCLGLCSTFATTSRETNPIVFEDFCKQAHAETTDDDVTIFKKMFTRVFEETKESDGIFGANVMVSAEVKANAMKVMQAIKELREADPEMKRRFRVRIRSPACASRRPTPAASACAAHLPPRPARPTPSSLKTSASRHTPRPPMTM